MRKWLCFPLLILLLLCGCQKEEAGLSTQFFAMDTLIDLTVFGETSPQESEVSDAIVAEVNRLDSLLSRHNANSAVSALNLQAGSAASVDPEVYDLLQKAVSFSLDTDNCFDISVAPIMDAWDFTGENPRVPSVEELHSLLTHVGNERIVFGENHTVTLEDGMSIDLGGIAKGYASDRIRTLFEENNISSGKISLGGNVYVHGAKPDGSPWRIAVEDPNHPGSYLGVLHICDKFAITSGGYQRYFEQNGIRYYHIIDPHTGDVARNGLVSATVVCDNGTLGDAFSTALFVMGYEKAVEFWRTYETDFEMILVDENNCVYVTEGLKDHFDTSLAEYEYEYIFLTKN